MFLDLVSNTIDNYINHIFQQMINTFSNVLVNIMSITDDVLEFEGVIQAMKYFKIIAISYIAIKIIIEASSTYILYTNGDSNADPGGLLIRAMEAVVVVSCIPDIVKFIFKLGITAAKDIANFNTKGKVGLESIFKSDLGTPVIGITIMGIACIIFLIIIFIQTFVRAAEFSLLAIVGSIMAVNLVSANRSLFKVWFKQVITVSGTQALQILMIKLSFSIITSLNIGLEMSIPMFLGWLWVIFKTPSYLKQWIYSSGLGGVAGNVASSMGSAVIMRKIITKGK